MFYTIFLKRVLDLFAALAGLPFFALVFLFVAPVIYFTDRGPIFYNAPRLGYKGKVFKMFKFRSMRVDAPDLRNADGSTFNGEDDPRVTPIGRFLRKSSIDEVPQLLNVLLGDMSLVGPRAHLTTHYHGYEALDEAAKRRLSVRPGITGYNQAYYRNSATLEEKFRNDLYYVDHLSCWLDLKILARTFTSVLARRNVYARPENSATRKSK